MIFGSLFRPRHSLILTFDKFQPNDSDSFFEKLEEIKRFYRWSTLSDLISHPKKGNVAIVFENPRKGAFLTVIPVLVADKIPFTLALRTDCIGTNRLPLEEEIELYRNSYPEKTSLLGREARLSREDLRAKFGPFPIEKSDPLDYFVTWGKIKELPPQSFEAAVNVYDNKNVEEEIRFIERQIGKIPQFALSKTDVSPLKKHKIRAVVTPREGIVEGNTSLYDLPRYILEKND